MTLQKENKTKDKENCEKGMDDDVQSATRGTACIWELFHVGFSIFSNAAQTGTPDDRLLSRTMNPPTSDASP
jgi:hypothetical protein